MPWLQCSTCEDPVFEIYSVLELVESKNDSTIGDKRQAHDEASRKHALVCSGKKPTPKPPESLPHRYFTGQPWSERMKGPCKTCGRGARDPLHYQDGRYL